MGANSSKGAANLASVLQGRMNKVSNRSAIVAAEMGVILDGKKLKVDSMPDYALMPDDYSVGSNLYCLHKDCVHIEHLKSHCNYLHSLPGSHVNETINTPSCQFKDCPENCLKNGLHKGDRVLVIWTNDGEPIIVDRIV